MPKIKLQKRAVYAGDAYIALLKAGWSIADATKFVRELPTAEAESVRHGRWEPCFEDWREQIEGDKCPVCGFEHSCGVRGCRLLREAADALETHESHVMALRREIEKLRAKMEALLDENERLKADKDKNAPIKWVSVEERLPGYNRHVLCYRPDMAMKIVISSYDGHYGDDDEGWYEGWSIYGYDLNGNCVITHWMPLPEGPEEGV